GSGLDGLVAKVSVCLLADARIMRIGGPGCVWVLVFVVLEREEGACAAYRCWLCVECLLPCHSFCGVLYHYAECWGDGVGGAPVALRSKCVRTIVVELWVRGFCVTDEDQLRCVQRSGG
ncbi:hypothetical protein EMWEY_00058600, partial [Eimeria maxima]